MAAHEPKFIERKHPIHGALMFVIGAGALYMGAFHSRSSEFRELFMAGWVIGPMLMVGGIGVAFCDLRRRQMLLCGFFAILSIAGRVLNGNIHHVAAALGVAYWRHRRIGRHTSQAAGPRRRDEHLKDAPF